jgi:hypothetical protein
MEDPIQPFESALEPELTSTAGLRMQALARLAELM